MYEGLAACLRSITAQPLVAHPSRRIGKSGGSEKAILLFALSSLAFLVVGLD